MNNKFYFLLESIIDSTPPWQNHVQKFSTDFLYDIRDRNVGNTTDDGNGNIWTVDQLEQDIRQNGIKQPLIITVGKLDKHIRLEHGNHRIIIAHDKLNMMHVPTVCIMRDRCECINGHNHRYLYPGPMNLTAPSGSYAKPYDIFQM